MKLLRVILAIIGLIGAALPASSQAVTRICTQGTVNGQPNCVDISGANPLPVSAGGYDSGSAPLVTNAAPANSSHTAGKVVGGLYTIPIARAVGTSGAVSRFFGFSAAGDTTGLLWRIWDKNPGATTCTDNANFVGSATDDVHLIAQPFTATPTAPAQTQGDAKTYFEVDFTPPASFKNQDTIPTTNVYACAVAAATFTPGVGAYSVNATGYQN